MAVSLSPSATGTPPPGAPAAGGSDAAASQSAELVSVDDVFMAELMGAEAEATTAGSEATPGDPDLTDDDDASASADGEEATDEEPSTEEESAAETNDDDETTEGEDPADQSEEGEGEGETATPRKAGTPAAVRKALQDAKIPHGLLKRIDKAFEHSRTYREEAEQLRTQLAQTPEPVTLTPTAAHPLSDVQTPEQLADRRAAAEFWLDWCGDNPDGGSIGTGSQSRELTGEETKQQRQWATAVLKSLPDRQQWLAVRQAARATAQKANPDMFRKDKPQYQAAQALLKGTPELVNQPDYELTLADTVRGLEYRVKMDQGYTIALIPPSSKKGKSAAADSASGPNAGTKPSKPKAPNSLPHSKPSPSPTGGKPDIAALYSKAATSGSEVDLDRLLEAELRG